jgi:hypothetical protein
MYVYFTVPHSPPSAGVCVCACVRACVRACVCVCLRMRVRAFVPRAPSLRPDRRDALQREPDRRRRRGGARLQPAGLDGAQDAVPLVSAPLSSDDVCVFRDGGNIYIYIYALFASRVSPPLLRSLQRLSSPVVRVDRPLGPDAASESAGSHRAGPFRAGDIKCLYIYIYIIVCSGGVRADPYMYM